MRILACGAHPDDVEIGCGATLAQAIARGHEVRILDMTRGEMGSNGSVEQREAEADAAAAALGLDGRLQAGLPDGFLNAADDRQCLALAAIFREHRPELLILPAPENRHPDHDQAHRLARAAAFKAGLSALDLAGDPWRPRLMLATMERRILAPHFIVPTEEGAAAKEKALACYGSQFFRGEGRAETLINDPRFLDWIRARDAYYGGLAQATRGEPFVALGPVVLEDLVPLAARLSP